MQIRSRLLALVPFTLTALALGAGAAAAQDATADPVTGGATAAAPAAGASGNTAPSPPVREARVNLRLKGLNHGRLTVGNRFTAAGTLAPYV
ncbi:MAG: hypothetical protein E4H22_04925, partial [Solirubrobacterales bacterium]